MKRWIGFGLAIVLSAAAVAQNNRPENPALARPKNPDFLGRKVPVKSTWSRMDRVYGAMLTRFAAQEDVWFEDGDFPATVHLLRLHNAFEPRDYDVATNLGWLLESIERKDEALATYIRYAKHNPSDPDRHFPEANFYFQTRAFAKVPPLMEPTIRSAQAHPNCYRILAHSYERMNMLTDSKRVWQLYLKRQPNDESAKLNLRRVSDKIARGGK